jgi:ankyrin repeat protein
MEKTGTQGNFEAALERFELKLGDHGAYEYNRSLGCGPDHPGCSLTVAVGQKELAIVDWLLEEKGARPDEVCPSDDMHYGGMSETPLCLASRFGYKEIARKLLEKGANVNAIISILSERVSPLLYTFVDKGAKERFVNNEISIVELLLEYGADPNLAGTDKLPLIEAVYLNCHVIVDLLLENGADPNLRMSQSEHFNQSALQIAVAHNELPMVEKLLEKGADPNKYGLGKTPLYSAIKNNNTDIVSRLLEKGATDKNLEELLDQHLDETKTVRTFLKIINPVKFSQYINNKAVLDQLKSLKDTPSNINEIIEKKYREAVTHVVYSNEIESIKINANPSKNNEFLVSEHKVEPEKEQSRYLPNVMRLIHSYLSLEDKANLIEGLTGSNDTKGELLPIPANLTSDRV